MNFTMRSEGIEYRKSSSFQPPYCQNKINYMSKGVNKDTGPMSEVSLFVKEAVSPLFLPNTGVSTLSEADTRFVQDTINPCIISV